MVSDVSHSELTQGLNGTGMFLEWCCFSTMSILKRIDILMNFLTSPYILFFYDWSHIHCLILCQNFPESC